MGCNDEDELNSLLTYYRDRINDFEKERLEWLAKLEEVRYSQEEKHKLEYRLKKKNEEIADLQRSLTEQKVSLFDERQ
jgi:coiled-coil domain-containing protein 77